MKNNYSDIIAKAGKPFWYNENGVPRYTEFHPFKCVHKDSDEVALVEVKCQSCGESFLVALTLPAADRLTQINGKSLHYGDPPNVGCCCAGPTMSSEFNAIIQVWTRSKGPTSPWMQLDSDAIAAIGAKSEVGIWD